MIKMYWKDGFYDTPIDGGIEISRDYWMSLLDGQSEGKMITENDKGYPILTDPKVDVMAVKLAALDHHDKSEAVNSFSIQSISMWLDKDTRAGLRLRFDAEVAAGKTDTTLWHGTTQIPLPLTTAQQMLLAVEVYASQCYDCTQAHRAAIMQLSTDIEIQAYDFTTGYPAKLNFEIHG